MLLKINNLEVRYGRQEKPALSIERSVVFEEGERIGIIGSNGAGKTTLVKALLGLVKYRGSITTELKPEEMAVHLQFNEYVNTMSVKHIMETVLHTSIRKNQKLQELIEYFEFGPCLGKRYKALSGGQKQRFTIIMVMMQDAPLTFYDEITSGLDFETRQKLMEMLMKWYQDKENTLCIVSHYYEELELLADKLLILDQGKLVDYGDKKELFHKYCGKSIIITDNQEKNRELLKDFSKLASPEHLIAVPCSTVENEKVVIGCLIQNNVNFKRSNNDIEMMYMNAKTRFNEAEGKKSYEKKD